MNVEAVMIGVRPARVAEVVLIVTCPGCNAKYRYDTARFGGAASKRLKCPKCGEVFEVANPAAEELDSTNIGKGKEPPRQPLPGTDTDRLRVEPEPPELPALAPLPKDLRFSLAVIAGSQAGSVFQLTRPRVYLGRGSTMDVQLNDAEVSRRHAMLEIRDEEATIQDLGSTNGTFVAGERVQRATIGHQQEFTLGSTTLMFLVTPIGNGAM